MVAAPPLPKQLWWAFYISVSHDHRPTEPVIVGSPLSRRLSGLVIVPKLEASILPKPSHRIGKGFCLRCECGVSAGRGWRARGQIPTTYSASSPSLKKMYLRFGGARWSRLLLNCLNETGSAGGAQAGALCVHLEGLMHVAAAENISPCVTHYLVPWASETRGPRWY